MPTVELTVKANDKASGTIKGVTSAIGGAMIAVKVIGEAFKVFGDVSRKAFEMSKATGGDFAKVMDGMKKTQDDLMKSLAGVAAVIGKDLAKGFQDITKGITDFLNNSENIGTISAIFTTLGNVIKDIAGVIGGNLTKTFDTLKSSFSQLSSAAGEGLDQFTLFAGIIELVKSAINVLFVALNAVIKNFVNVVTVVIEAAKTFGAFFDVLSGKKKWSDFADQAKKTGEAVVKVGTDLVEGYQNFFTTIGNEAKNYTSNVQKEAQKQRDTYIQKQKEAADEHRKTQQQMTQVVKTENKEQENAVKKTTEENKKTFKDYWTEIQGAAISAGSSIGSAVTSIIEGINEAQRQSTDTQLALIDAETQKKLEAAGLQEATRTEQLNNELVELQSSLTRAQTIENASAINKQIKEKQDEIARTKILNDAEADKTKIKKKSLQDEFQRKTAAFNAQKAIDIVTAGAQLALGIASAATAGAQFPGPAALVMIPLLVSLVSAAGIASIAALASKQAPAAPTFAAGVTNFAGGAALVGERGPEMVTLPGGSNVITNENIGRMMNTGNININTVNVSANNPLDFARQLTELRRYEYAR